MDAFSQVAMVIVPRTYGGGMCGDFEFFALLPLPRCTKTSQCDLKMSCKGKKCTLPSKCKKNKDMW